MKDKVLNAAWGIGVRAYRLSRWARVSNYVAPAFVRLSRLFPGTDQPVLATLRHGERFRMPPRYRDTRTVINGLFQKHETDLLERTVKTGMTFVDVGAYVGYFTVLASTWVGQTGRSYAFEPDRLAYEFLKRNVEMNRCANVILVNCAVADRIGEMALVRDPLGPESFLTERYIDNSTDSVATVTLDSFFESVSWPQVDIMKMNIEGSELKALKGMPELSRLNPGLQLVMEFNPTAMVRAGVTRADLQAVLSELGFRRGQVVERNLSDVPRPDLLPVGSTVYNILLTK